MLSLVVVSAVLAAPNSDWACEFEHKQWSEAGLEAPCRVFADADHSRWAPSAKSAWKLGDEPAKCIAAAWNGKELNPGAVADCVEASPGAFPLWVALAKSNLMSRGGKIADERWAQLEAALARQPDPSDVADRLIDLQFGPATLGARVLLAKHPDRLADVLSRNQLLGPPGLEVAYPLLLAAPRRTPPLSEKDWLALGVSALRGALAQAELTLANEIWNLLPATTRRAVVNTPLYKYWGRVGGDMKLTLVPGGDYRAQLALALALAGNKADAKAVIQALNPDAGDPHEDPRAAMIVRALVDYAVGAPRTLNAWDAAIALRSTHGGLGSSDAIPLVLDFVAPYQGMLHRMVENQIRYGGSPGRELHGAELTARLATIHAETAAKLKRINWPSAIEQSDAGAPVTLPPAPSVFAEAKKPFRGAPPVAADPKSLSIPAGVWPVRAERHQKQVVVLAQSHRVDPVGEVSAGGYWLLVSNDGGQRWQQLYLGLSDHRPWHAQDSSKVPLLEGGVVRLEVSEAPIDDRTVSFPPVATRADAVREHVVLEGKLADVERDSDGDGLTDLLEARLLLDPKNKDTDHDGVPDGDDLTPRLNDSLTPTARAEVFNAFFESREQRRRPAALVVPPSGADAGLEHSFGRLRSKDLEDVQFLVGTPATLAGLKPLTRVVTLSDAELTAACKRYGDFYPMGIELIVSQDGQHAYLDWSEGWTGGSFRADRQADGRWELTSLGEWVS